MITSTSLTPTFTLKILKALREAQEDYLMTNIRDRAVLTGGRALVFNRKGNASIRVRYVKGSYEVVDLTVRGGRNIGHMLADRLPALANRLI